MNWSRSDSADKLYDDWSGYENLTPSDEGGVQTRTCISKTKGYYVTKEISIYSKLIAKQERERERHLT